MGLWRHNVRDKRDVNCVIVDDGNVFFKKNGVKSSFIYIAPRRRVFLSRWSRHGDLFAKWTISGFGRGQNAVAFGSMSIILWRILFDVVSFLGDDMGHRHGDMCSRHFVFWDDIFSDAISLYTTRSSRLFYSCFFVILCGIVGVGHWSFVLLLPGKKKKKTKQKCDDEYDDLSW